MTPKIKRQKRNFKREEARVSLFFLDLFPYHFRFFSLRKKVFLFFFLLIVGCPQKPFIEFNIEYSGRNIKGLYEPLMRYLMSTVFVDLWSITSAYSLMIYYRLGLYKCQ
jgi:hypothetical protein